MRSRLTIKTHAFLERHFPERRVFLKSDNDTRFIRLRPLTQVAAYAGASVVVAWAIIATAILLMDSIGSGNFREQAKRDRATYEDRLNALSHERDARAEEALAAQYRFNAALTQISVMQSELLASETRRRELETGVEVIQATLRDTMKEREEARAALKSLREEENGSAVTLAATAPVQMTFMADALADTAEERDRIEADAQAALEARASLEHEILLMREHNDQIFRQLEEAMTISVEPLDKMFRSAGMPTDQIIEQVRRGYSGQGGPLTPLALTTRGEDEQPSPDEQRANRLLNQMETLNFYRIAAQRAPFANPVHAAVRFTSGFGYRRDPKTGGRRMHKGADFAGAYGTDIYATADGIVTHAGWLSGYGRLVKVRHDFGIETWYAHNSRILVRKGQRVSRGEHIADMGNTGRVTGTHLHYEVRVNGRPVNPMIYIKAARNVF